MSTFRYFAYGSNMFPAKLALAAPSAKVVTIGTLDGYSIRFNKKGRDDSAKCTVVPSAETTWGVLYTIDTEDRATLVESERGYAEQIVLIKTADREVSALTFCAQSEYIDDSLSPFDWYREYCIAGAKLFSLPPEYIEMRLAGVPAISDPDPERHTKHYTLLQSSG